MRLDHTAGSVEVGSDPHQHSKATERPQSPHQRHELSSLKNLRASAKHGLHEAAAAALSDTAPNFPGSLGYGYGSKQDDSEDGLAVLFQGENLDFIYAGVARVLESPQHFMMQLRGDPGNAAHSPTNPVVDKEGWDYSTSPSAGRNTFTERRSPLEYRLQKSYDLGAPSPSNGVSASGTGVAGALAHLALVVSDEKHWGGNDQSSSNILAGNTSKAPPRQLAKHERARAQGLEELAHASEAAAKAIQGLQLAETPETPAMEGVLQDGVGGVYRNVRASKADALVEAWQWQSGQYHPTKGVKSSNLGWASRPAAQVLVAAILLGHRHCRHEHQEGNGAPSNGAIRGNSSSTDQGTLTAAAAQWALAAVDAASQALCVIMRAAAEANEASFGDDDATRSGKDKSHFDSHRADTALPSMAAKLLLPQWVMASGAAEACRAALETCLNTPHLVPGFLPPSSSRASKLAAKKAAAQSTNHDNYDELDGVGGAAKGTHRGVRSLAASAAADAQCTRQLPSGCLALLAATATALALPSPLMEHTVGVSHHSSPLEWLHHLATAPVQDRSSVSGSEGAPFGSSKSAPKWPVSRALLPLLSRTLQLFDLSLLGMGAPPASPASNTISPGFAVDAAAVTSTGGRSPNHNVTIAEDAIGDTRTNSEEGSGFVADTDDEDDEEEEGSTKEVVGIAAPSLDSPQRETGSPTALDEPEGEAQRKAAARLRIVHRADRFRRYRDK